ncbi:DUF481 domain-containing protein [Litorilituus lipolyticus]|uniref:DUF481 domain-containing protein n=1 Tax=Litorilituus lipolyticus TaxID=2491017 RepID=A0A502LA22_9GAMM|nr:DUF481 domain-containing protein [Litorilituus lipolyticus]TPH17107.1 DUF481 domain-containing protein [Litorilituus lipolyticus]
MKYYLNCLVVITLSFFYSLNVTATTYPENAVEKSLISAEQASSADILSSLEKADEKPEKKKSTFSASAQLGLLYQTGNTKSGDVKAGLDLRYEKNLWRSLFIFDALLKKTEIVNSDGEDNFETTDNKWSVVTQTNYTINSTKRNYLYGNLFYEENRFSSFDSQASLSTGWGRRWYETSSTSFDADVGPGFKRDVTRPTTAEREEGIGSETRDSLILQAQALYIQKINEHIEFKQLLVAKHAIEKGENSLYKSETSLTSKLIDSLQIKLSFIVDYNSKVDPNKANTDTQTAAVLVYSF